MTEQEFFIRAICESPDDDTPRLVYADWQDEHAASTPCPHCAYDGCVNWGKICTDCGGSHQLSNGFAERAEFIRVQCELARLGDECSTDDPDYCQKFNHWSGLRRRERELLREDGPLSKEFSRYFSTPEGQGFWIGDVCFHAIFRRGFLEQIAGVSWDVWLKYAGVLLAAQPIRKVRLTTRPTTEPSTRSGYVVGQHSGHFHFYDARDNMLITEFPGIDFELPTP